MGLSCTVWYSEGMKPQYHCKLLTQGVLVSTVSPSALPRTSRTLLYPHAVRSSPRRTTREKSVLHHTSSPTRSTHILSGRKVLLIAVLMLCLVLSWRW